MTKESGESLLEHLSRYNKLLADKRLRVPKEDVDSFGNLITSPVTMIGIAGDDEVAYRPVRTGTVSGYTGTYYPTSTEAGTNVSSVINIQTLTAGAPIVDVQPTAGYLNTVQYIRAQGGGAFAANRQLQVRLYDAANFISVYDSLAVALVGTEDGLVHPTDEFTAVATYPATRNEFDVHNGSYLRFIATGLVAAEQIILYIHMISRDAGGLG